MHLTLVILKLQKISPKPLTNNSYSLITLCWYVLLRKYLDFPIIRSKHKLELLFDHAKKRRENIQYKVSQLKCNYNHIMQATITVKKLMTEHIKWVK